MNNLLQVNAAQRLTPQDILVDKPGSYRKTGRNYNRIKLRTRYRGMNWSRRSSRRAHDPIVRIYSEIHYLTEHAPKAVKQRWEQARVRLHDRTRWWRAGINERL